MILLNVPARQFLQLLLPFVELYVPGEHALQLKVVSLPLLKNPSSHKSHVAAPVRLLDVPNGHVEQLLLPFVELYVPSGHALQLMAGRLPLL